MTAFFHPAPSSSTEQTSTPFRTVSPVTATAKLLGLIVVEVRRKNWELTTPVADAEKRQREADYRARKPGWQEPHSMPPLPHLRLSKTKKGWHLTDESTAINYVGTKKQVTRTCSVDDRFRQQ